LYIRSNIKTIPLSTKELYFYRSFKSQIYRHSEEGLTSMYGKKRKVTQEFYQKIKPELEKLRAEKLKQYDDKLVIQVLNSEINDRFNSLDGVKAKTEDEYENIIKTHLSNSFLIRNALDKLEELKSQNHLQDNTSLQQEEKEVLK